MKNGNKLIKVINYESVGKKKGGGGIDRAAGKRNIQ